MKLKDLKIGEEYAAGSKNYPDRVTLLSVGGWVPYRPGKNRWQNSTAAHRKEGATGCQVRRGFGGIDVIMPAQILSTWAEHEASEALKKATKIKEATEGNRRSTRCVEIGRRIDAICQGEWGWAIASSYLGYSNVPENQDAYLDGLSELVALAERAGRGEG